MLTAHQVQMIPLGRLRFGHEHPSANVNVRRHKPGEAADLVASIAQEGVLQSLFVVPGEAKSDALYVVAGGRRLTALRALREQDRIDEGTPIPCIVSPSIDTASALAKSIAENDTHVPPHPVDRYEAFARLRDEAGVPEEDIAARFFIELRVVKQALALAALSPKIREAWRKGEIRADVAQAFTLGKNHKVQDALFKKLTKGLDPDQRLAVEDIRDELGATDASAARFVNFVGVDAYREAGGTLTEDLFDGDHIVDDKGLAQSLAQNRLERECQKRTGDGWSWAEVKDTLPSSWSYSWTKFPGKIEPTPEEERELAELSKAAIAFDEFDCSDAERDAMQRAASAHERLENRIRARSFSTQEMAQSGCVLSIGTDGGLDIVYGVVKPKAVSDDKIEKKGGAVKDAPAKTKVAKKPPVESAIPGDLVGDMQDQLTNAVSDVLPLDADVALATLIAGLNDGLGFHDGPVGIEVTVAGGDFKPDRGGFATVFAAALKLPRDKKLAWLARITAGIVEIDRFNIAEKKPANKERHAAVVAMLDALPAQPLLEALRKRWNAKDYFDRAPKAFALAALKEACGAGAHDSVVGHDAATIKKSAIANVPKTGWLPPELRPSCYVAPKASSSAAIGQQKKPGKAAETNGAAKSNGANGHAKPKPKGAAKTPTVAVGKKKSRPARARA